MSRERSADRRVHRAVVSLSYVKLRILPRVGLFLVGRLSHRNASFSWWVALHAGISPQEVSAPTQRRFLYEWGLFMVYGVKS